MNLKLMAFFSLFCISIYGQEIPVDEVTGKFKYEQVFQVDGIEKNDIYASAKDWIVRSLKSSDNAVNFYDQDKNSINATGNLLLSEQGRFDHVVLNFKFSVYIKQGRYKVIIDNFILSYEYISVINGAVIPRIGPLEEGFKKEPFINGDKQTLKLFAEIDSKLQKMISDLDITVSSGKMPGDSDDW